jgi:hypothetical protein
MTTYLHFDNAPTRLACDDCLCQITVINEPDMVAYDNDDASLIPAYTRRAAGYRLLDRDEPAAYAPSNCDCRCHTTARRFLTNCYDPV